MQEKDYPFIYKISNDESAKNQICHFRVIKFEYFINFLIVIGSSFGENKSLLIVLIVSIALLILLNFLKKIWDFEKKWYKNRALTESLKTLTWKWMMNSAESESDFRKKLEPFFKEIEGVESIEIDELITDEMNKIKELGDEEKFQYYKKNRIEDQEKWYLKKTKENKKKVSHFLYFTVTVYSILFLIMLFNLSVTLEKMININVGIFILLATIFTSWSNSRKYAELEEAYSITLNDIMFLKREIMDYSEVENFNTYISNCENAFSREHTQWFARKND